MHCEMQRATLALLQAPGVAEPAFACNHTHPCMCPCPFQVLAAPAGREQLEVLGELMRQSHASYSRCGLGSGEGRPGRSLYTGLRLHVR